MPKFGRRSRERLETCHSDLQVLFKHIVEDIDCSILCGHRGEEDQNKAVAEGRSKAVYPKGRHNASPSLACDVAPYPIDWDDKDRWYFFAGFVLSTAKVLKDLGEISHDIRWGGNWRGFKNGVIDFKKNTFNDLPHFEIVEH